MASALSSVRRPPKAMESTAARGVAYRWKSRSLDTTARHKLDMPPYCTVLRESPYGGDVIMASIGAFPRTGRKTAGACRASASTKAEAPGSGVIEASSRHAFRRRRSKTVHASWRTVARPVAASRWSFHWSRLAKETSRTVALSTVANRSWVGQGLRAISMAAEISRSSRVAWVPSQSTLRPARGSSLGVWERFSDSRICRRS